jgi:hypothetical protein
MLSHAMVIPIGLTQEHFSIGRSGVDDENDFELDGMGIQDKHCEIRVARGAANAAAAKATVRAMSKAAHTTVNGKAVPMDEVPLTHLDRVVFGPTRMLCLYLTQPLTQDQRAQLT